jgi:exodeoxyribonuclease VII small subunit
VTKSPAVQKEHTFENSLNRLQQIVETLEEGSVNLEEVMKMYEEGVELSKRCLEQLQQVEVRLKRLGKEMNGGFKLTDETLEE